MTKFLARGEFSFVPPENWVRREMPGFKYQFAFGPIVNKLTPKFVITGTVRAEGVQGFDKICDSSIKHSNRGTNKLPTFQD